MRVLMIALVVGGLGLVAYLLFGRSAMAATRKPAAGPTPPSSTQDPKTFTSVTDLRPKPSTGTVAGWNSILPSGSFFAEGWKPAAPPPTTGGATVPIPSGGTAYVPAVGTAGAPTTATVRPR